MKQRHYQGNDFLFEAASPEPIEVTIDKKVSLLYQLCVLCKNKKNPDSREAALREVLSQYGSERALTIALHDVVSGNKSINTFLEQKCYNETKGVN